MHSFFSRTVRLVWIISCFSGLLVLLIWFQIWQQISNDRRAAINEAVLRNDNLVVSLEQYAIRTIRNADAVLQLVKMEYERKGASIDFDQLFRRGVIDPGYFNGVAIVDEDGYIRNTNLDLDTMLNIADREHFYFHKEKRDELFISQPIRSRVIGKAALVLSRRIDNPDGSFGGTVLVQVEPATFTQFYSSANLNDNDIISLISPSGITYARRTGSRESFGEDISKSPLFQHLKVNKTGNYQAKDAIRGVPSLFSYRQLANYPVIATAGMAREDALADYYENRNRVLAFAIFISLLILLFTLVISIVIVSRKRHTNRIRQSEKKYRSIFDNSHDGIIVTGEDGSLIAINEAGADLFRVNPAKSIGYEFYKLFETAIPPVDLLTDTKKEIEFTRNNGTSFTGEIAISSFMENDNERRLVVMIRDISLRREMDRKLLEEQKRHQHNLTKQVILAQEREREIIGHELHDNVNQILTTVKLYLEHALSRPESEKELLKKSIGHIMDCISEIRHLSKELSAPTLGNKSLIESIQGLVDVVREASGIPIEFNYKGYHTTLVKDQKLAIYRILQEQFNNILKHANATCIQVSLFQDTEKTVIRIRDNGKGFNVSQTRNGIGLNNILSRTRVFGGMMKLNSAPMEGCELIISLPIKYESGMDTSRVSAAS